jgi:hypothetical protein
MCYVFHESSLSNLRPRTEVSEQPFPFQYRFKAHHGNQSSNQENRRKKSEDVLEVPENEKQIKMIIFHPNIEC